MTPHAGTLSLMSPLNVKFGGHAFPFPWQKVTDRKQNTAEREEAEILLQLSK